MAFERNGEGIRFGQLSAYLDAFESQLRRSTLDEAGYPATFLEFLIDSRAGCPFGNRKFCGFGLENSSL